MEYSAVYRKEPEGGYTAWALELRGAVTYGETLDEARELLAETVCLLLESYARQGWTPPPLPLDDELPPDADVIREPLHVAA